MKLQRVLDAIDAANGVDPRRTPDGKPLELDHSERMTAWVRRLSPTASDLLHIAARGQHIERWTSPRTDFPEGRSGYLHWREDLKRFHARRTGDLMAAAGYSAADIDRVSDLITKTAHRAGDPEGRILEDALCLVFLETQFKDLLSKISEDKMAGIIRKTWQKMSPAGQTAVSSLSLSPEEHRALTNALTRFPDTPT
jgi:hypothetical protein